MSGCLEPHKIAAKFPPGLFIRTSIKPVVDLGHEVRLLDCQVGEQATVTVVRPEDSRPERGLVSCVSPLGASLIGGRVGDAIEIDIFGRKIAFVILNIR